MTHVACGLPLWGTTPRTEDLAMKSNLPIHTRIVIIGAIAVATAGIAYAMPELLQWVAGEPQSVMGPGYNPPPPWIPIS